MATIECLSPELLVQIFSHYIQDEGHDRFLRNIPRVCKVWNGLLANRSLWREVIVWKDWFQLLHISRRGLLYHTQSLTFDYYYQTESFHGPNLLAVLKNIRDLKALNLPDLIMGSDALTVVTERCPHLESFHLNIAADSDDEYDYSRTPHHEWNQFLTVCGPTLKHIDLIHYGSDESGQRLVSRIAAKCPQLERLKIFFMNTRLLTIHELRSGCPRMRELELHRCHLIATESNDGFVHLKEFRARECDFDGLDVYHLLKDSINLEHLELFKNENLVFSSIWKIPSEKVKILKIDLKHPIENLNPLGEAVWKWRRSLSDLELRVWKYDISYVLRRLLHNNPNPQLEFLHINRNVNLHFLKEFAEKCKNLNCLLIGQKSRYVSREQIERSFLMKRRFDT